MNVRYLLHDSLLVVIAQRATELVVVHGWTVLLHAPQPGNLRGGVKVARYVHASDVTSLHIPKIIIGCRSADFPCVASRGPRW